MKVPLVIFQDSFKDNILICRIGGSSFDGKEVTFFVSIPFGVQGVTFFLGRQEVTATSPQNLPK